MPFPFLQLPAEIRNTIYEYVALNNGQPFIIRPTRSRFTNCFDRSLPVPPRGSCRDRMSRARVCRQIRQEYYKVFINFATVAVFCRHLKAFQDDFIKRTDEAFGQCPNNLVIYIRFEFFNFMVGDIAPLLTKQARSGTFSCRFEVDNVTPILEVDPAVCDMPLHCDIPNSIFALQDPIWVSLVRDGLLQNLINDVGGAGEHTHWIVVIDGSPENELSEARRSEIKECLKEHGFRLDYDIRKVGVSRLELRLFKVIV